MNYGILLAGGVGTRMGADRPKQYLLAGEKPIIAYALKIFEKHEDIDRIVLVADEAWRDYIREWIEKEEIRKPLDFADPGETRQHSIYNALKCCAAYAKEDDIVIVHDAARPLVSDQIIRDCIDGAKGKGGSMPVIPVKDTVYRSEDGKTITSLLTRSEIFAGQAPEAFRFGKYYEIHNMVSDEEIRTTAGSSEIAYRHGTDICLVQGSERNFKITGREDLERFEQILNQKEDGINGLEYRVKVKAITLQKSSMKIRIVGRVRCKGIEGDYVPKAKLVLGFSREEEDRRIPFVMQESDKDEDSFCFSGDFAYDLDYIFWETRESFEPFRLGFHLFCGTEYVENIDVDLSEVQVMKDDKAYYDCDVEENGLLLKKDRKKTPKNSGIRKCALDALDVVRKCFAVILIPVYLFEVILSYLYLVPTPYGGRDPLKRTSMHIQRRMKTILRKNPSVTELRKWFFKTQYNRVKRKPIIQNRITFISQRREELSGNFAFVYDKLKDEEGLDIKFWFNNKNPQDMNLREIREFCRICAESKTIVLDEYTPQIHYFPLKSEITIVQLWHACGAFKTFGFTRLDKPKGSPQMTNMHRNYDYVTVSSSFCRYCHSEGFGIATDHVVPTGIPRTDVFFDEDYKKKMQDDFYQKYPAWREKKIIMFAPTFRGMTREDAFYPMDRFRVEKVMEQLGDEYAMIIKHHPFVTEKQPIPQCYKDRVIDLSDSTELNDLMFVCDLIITDYSSLIFEASLLRIPMLFYVYDLEEYIADRDFYFDLKLMSPGKLVYSQKELIRAIREQDFESERIEEFKKLFFDHTDGKSSERVAGLIMQTVKREEES